MSITEAFFDKCRHEHRPQGVTTGSALNEATASAKWWDSAKTSLRRDYVAATKAAKRSTRNGHRKTLSRLYVELRSDERNGDRLIGPRRPPADIRVAIASTKRRWQEGKAARLRRVHAHHTLRSPRDFFKRFSTKYLDNTIYELGGQTTAAAPTALAEAMATGWKPIMQQKAAQRQGVQRYLAAAWKPAMEVRAELHSLDQMITEDETATAIKRCKRGKAVGPDGLPNDWYRDNQIELTPLLCRLFNPMARGQDAAPAVPSAAATAIAALPRHAHPIDTALDALPGLTKVLWQYEYATTVADIWRLRYQVIDGTPSNDHEIQARQATVIRRGHIHLRQVILRHAEHEELPAVMNAFRCLSASIQQDQPITVARTLLPTTLFVLYFDGGSRGNPGPGGSGSVLVQLAADGSAPEVIWVASMAYGSRRTTNNIAEYKGLLHGLRYALQQGCRPLHVVGDSQMIIRQHQDWRSPRKAASSPLQPNLSTRAAAQRNLLDTPLPEIQQNGRRGGQHRDGHAQIESTPLDRHADGIRRARAPDIRRRALA